MKNFSKNIVLWIIIGLLLVALFNLFQGTSSNRNASNISFSDFIVTYKFEDHDVLRNIDYEHHYFGRLRLSKLKDK